MIFSTGVFVFSCIIWLANAIILILSYFLPGLFSYCMVLAPFIFIEIALTFYLCKKNGMDNSIIQNETPMFFVIVLCISFAYTVLNSIAFMILLGEGGPEIVDGVYCLYNHGFVREISEAEYLFLSRAETCLVAGLLLTFSAAPICIFSAVVERNKIQEHLDV